MGHFFSFLVFAMGAASNEKPSNPLQHIFQVPSPSTSYYKAEKYFKSISSDWPTLLFEEKAINFMRKILPGLKAPPWYFLISILDHCCVGSFRVNGKLHGGEQWLYILLLPPFTFCPALSRSIYHNARIPILIIIK